MAGLGVSMTGVNAIGAAERQRKALELRKAGATYEQIADSLGYSHPSGAQKAVKTAIRRLTRDVADDVRELELTRLDAMLFAIWPRVKQGNDYAIDRALKIMARRAEYLGLDAPAKVDITLLVKQAAEQLGLTEEERAELAADVTAFLAEQKATA